MLNRILLGDAIDALLSEDEDSSFFPPEIRQKVAAELGLDQPLPIQFGKWVWGVVRFDFGTSFWSKKSNLDIIKLRFSRTVELDILGAIVAISWGVTSGVLSAVYQNTWLDAMVRFPTVGGIAIPNFMVAVMIFYFLIHFLIGSPQSNTKVYSMIRYQISNNTLHPSWF